MQKITFAAIGAAALFALSGTTATAAVAQDSTPICSKTVTDNCMQREGRAAAAHRAPARHHVAAKHGAPARHRATKQHAAANHRVAPKRKVAARAAPAPAHRM